MATQTIYTTIAENTEEIEQAFEIRRKVFVEGQNVPMELERDGRDSECTHFLLWSEGELIGTGRMRNIGEDWVKFERMAVLRDYRNQGFGTNLLETMLEYARDEGYSRVTLHAQIDAVTYYERAGFEPEGEEFTEAGIVHITMNKDL